MTEITELDLDAIAARADAATPGPWVADDWEVYGSGGHDWVAETCDTDNEAQAKANGAFVAAARADVPALIAEIHRLRARLEES